MLKRLVFLFAISISYFCCIAHQSIDSLQLLVKSNPNKVIVYLEAHNFKQDTTVSELLLLTKAYENIGRFYKVDSLLEFAFTQFNFKKDSSNYIEFLRIESRVKKVLDMFEESLISLNYVLDYVKRKGDKLQLIDVYLQFAEYYRAADNYQMACVYLEKVNEAGYQIKGGFPPLLKARMMNRKAAVYLEHDVFLDSVAYFSKAVMQIATKYNNPDLVASSSNELGFLYLNKFNLNAKYWFQKSIDIWDSLGFYNYAYSARLNLARNYLKNNEPENAIQLAQSSLKVIRTYGWKWDEGYWNDVLSQSYQQFHDYKKAFFYLNKSKEQLLRTERTRYIEKLAYYANKIELKGKEHELREKNVEVKNVHLEMDNKLLENRFLFTMLLVAVFVLIGVVVFLFISKNQQKKIHQINKQLHQLVSSKEVLLQEVNHRVKNNLSLLSGLMYLKERELKDEVAIRAIREMNSRINTISLIHETLYQRDDVEHINFQEYLERLASQILMLFPEQQHVKVTINCVHFNPVLALAMPLSMMMNELITNSVKHAFKLVTQPEINIKYDAKLGMLSYADNGPGYNNDLATASFGKKMLGIFATQVNAIITYEKDGGTLVTKILLNNKHKR